MASQYNQSDLKVTRNYSNNSVQKTPFSIEDILYPHNSNTINDKSYVQSSQFSSATASDGPQSVKGPGESVKTISEEKKSNTSDTRSHVNKPNLGPSSFVPPPPPPPSVQQLSGHPPPSSYNPNSMYPTGYSDGYLHMIAPYLANTATGYKSVDPYFLSQGRLSTSSVN